MAPGQQGEDALQAERVGDDDAHLGGVVGRAGVGGVAGGHGEPPGRAALVSGGATSMDVPTDPPVRGSVADGPARNPLPSHGCTLARRWPTPQPPGRTGAAGPRRGAWPGTDPVWHGRPTARPRGDT
ncbi:hypothetical protein GCM10023328_40860 [Modestobacter marinus]